MSVADPLEGEGGARERRSGGVSQSTGGAILVGIYPAFWKVDKSRRCLEYNSIENADLFSIWGFKMKDGRRNPELQP